MLDRQRILIICCSNNELHTTVVKTFLKFLKAKCNVHVICVDNSCVMHLESAQDWLMQEINLAKKVILFHSEESVAMAWHFTKSAITPSHSVSVKIFMMALEMFSQSKVDQFKLINVYFSFTPSNYVVDINCGQTYQLMSEFDKFLTNVRGSSDFDSSSLLISDEGLELHRAIIKAADYAEVHPHDTFNVFNFLPPDTDSIDTESLISRMAADVGSNISDFGPMCSDTLLTSEAEV